MVRLERIDSEPLVLGAGLGVGLGMGLGVRRRLGVLGAGLELEVRPLVVVLTKEGRETARRRWRARRCGWARVLRGWGMRPGVDKEVVSY